jgi:hypothetical protein
MRQARLETLPVGVVGITCRKSKGLLTWCGHSPLQIPFAGGWLSLTLFNENNCESRHQHLTAEGISGKLSGIVGYIKEIIGKIKENF